MLNFWCIAYYLSISFPLKTWFILLIWSENSLVLSPVWRDSENSQAGQSYSRPASIWDKVMFIFVYLPSKPKWFLFPAWINEPQGILFVMRNDSKNVKLHLHLDQQISQDWAVIADKDNKSVFNHFYVVFFKLLCSLLIYMDSGKDECFMSKPNFWWNVLCPQFSSWPQSVS